jgi:hypothetical protein
MMLTCAKCGRKHPLTEDDVVFFYPRFFCLSCGDRLSFPLDESQLQQLRSKADRDRRLQDVQGLEAPDTIRRVHRRADGAGAESGG